MRRLEGNEKTVELAIRLSRKILIIGNVEMGVEMINRRGLRHFSLRAR